jgi:hypothetical protein
MEIITRREAIKRHFPFIVSAYCFLDFSHLDPETCTEEDIKSVLGNRYFGSVLQCTECHQSVDVATSVEDNDNFVCLCSSCLLKAKNLIENKAEQKDIIGPYSIEPHGPIGNYALYYQRDNNHHGYRLLNLNDGDSSMQSTLKLIVDALNSFAKRIEK